MAGFPAQDASRAYRVGTGGHAVPPPSALLIPAPQEEAPAPKETSRERLTCLAHYWAVFSDPCWGPVALQLSVWRDDQADLPEYEVIVE